MLDLPEKTCKVKKRPSLIYRCASEEQKVSLDFHRIADFVASVADFSLSSESSSASASASPAPTSSLFKTVRKFSGSLKDVTAALGPFMIWTKFYDFFKVFPDWGAH
jgi:hypothetical protein